MHIDKTLKNTRRTTSCAAAVGLAGTLLLANTALGQAGQYYIHTAGLTDMEHTRDDGYRWSTVQQINKAGQLRGQSDRYGGGATWLGVSVWLHRGGSTINIGLVDVEHTRTDGHRWSTSYHLNAAGQVSGASTRYIDLTDAGRSPWLSNGSSTIRLGLADAEHTRADGYKYGDIQQLNDAGHTRGESNRYIGSTAAGTSAWVFDGTETVRVGFIDSDYTRSDGYRFSATQQLNTAGQVRGVSNRYSGTTDMGRTAWLWNGTTTLNIGLLDAENIRADGYRHSSALELNDAGQVRGHALRYSGSLARGQSAWLYDGTSTINIGLIDAEHTRLDGHRSSETGQLNAAGHVRGHSERYSESTALGRSAWVYNGVETVKIGLVDAEHTRNDGRRYSTAQQLNDAGHVRGSSDRYVGSSAMGWSAWVYNGTGTVRIGLSDTEHTRADGYHWSASGQMNQAGHVRGFSQRYSGSTLMGSSAWRYDGNTSVNIGITDAEHTRADGWRRSEALHLNEAGQVHGFAERFTDSSAMGRTTWLYDGSDTIRIGLADAVHTRNDGYRWSEVQQLNEAGQVRGHSNRYSGSMAMGQTAWVYDPVLAESVPLLLSVRADGFASSSSTFLSEDGIVLGSYTLYDGMDSLGARPFYWHRNDGLHDLASLVDGGIDAYGWTRLASVVRGNEIAQIIGHGLLNDMTSGQMAYLLTPLDSLLPGDANADGKVNIADLSLLATNWQRGVDDGQTAYWFHGDFNHDGQVTIADLSILASNWQAGVDPSSATMTFAEAMAMFDVFNGVVVPEPAALPPLGLALMALKRRRSRARGRAAGRGRPSDSQTRFQEMLPERTVSPPRDLNHNQ